MDSEICWRNLPPDASEALVQDNFVRPFLLDLEYESTEICPQFSVGKRAVDYAVRKNDGSDIFLHTRSNPYLYVEVKGRPESFENVNQTSYRRALAQLKAYLLHNDSKTVKWGILTNSLHIQLFRKHGKVIHPVTLCTNINTESIPKIVKEFKTLTKQPRRALVIAVYNNKGGVGKTTTTLNVAATLTLFGKKVLIIDFDPNQSDLGDALNIESSQGKLYEILKSKNTDLREAIQTYKFEHPRLPKPRGFDVIPADAKLGAELDEIKLAQKIKLHALHRALQTLREDYDYVLIDAPPNWRIFAKKAIFAADVVLIPARHDNLHSLQNAGTAIREFIPEIQAERQVVGDAGPIALPIFMNNAFRVSDAQMQITHQAIAKIIRESKKTSVKTDGQEIAGVDLTSYFYPRFRKGHRDLRTISVPYMAFISKADFMHVPAAFLFKNAQEQYVNLVREYFI